jgi:hypothetical protein
MFLPPGPASLRHTLLGLVVVWRRWLVRGDLSQLAPTRAQRLGIPSSKAQ